MHNQSILHVKFSPGAVGWTFLNGPENLGLCNETGTYFNSYSSLHSKISHQKHTDLKKDMVFCKCTYSGIYITGSTVKSQNIKFDAPQGSLVGKYKAFGGKTSTLAWK